LPLALRAALAVPQVHDLGSIADYLHLDVAGARQKLFHVELADAKRLQRLRAAPLVGARHILRITHFAHAAPTAAGDGLQHHGAA